MHHNKCKVRSGSPVPDRVKAQCPPPQDPPGGCPPAALKRCCQYEQEAPPALICLPLLPAFYETDKQRPGRKEEKACPCCLQPLPPPKPDACGAPCPPAPPMPSKGHDCHHKAQNQAPMAGKGHDCCGKTQHQAPMIGMGHDCCGKTQHQAPPSGKGHDCCGKTQHQAPPSGKGHDCCGKTQHQAPPSGKGHDCCTKNKQHQLMGGSASSNAHSCHHHDGGAKHDECGQKIPVPAAICCPMPEHHMVCPPFGTDLPCAHEIEMQCTDSCAPPPPPCWQPMSTAHGQQSERCPTPCLAPRLPPCPPACTPGAECLPDQRGALRPDQRDCPALGRNFCVHEAAAPRCPGAPPHESSECDHKMVGMLENAAAFQTALPATRANSPYCAPSDYNDMYCGRSGTGFPMYCAASCGLQKSAPGHARPRQPREGAGAGAGAGACPALEPCCAGAGLAPTFVLTADGCCSRACQPPPPRDPDVPRRVGGFSRSMPSPACWI